MFTFTLTPDDGEAIEVKADSRDVYTWERTGRGVERSLKALLERMAMGDLYAVAWHAAKRTGQVAIPLDEFVQVYVLDFEEDAEGGDVDPTQPGP